MRLPLILPVAAVGIAMFMTTSAQAVPPCSSDPALNACNKYGFRTNLCQQCKSCLGKGGKIREITFKGKRSILCKVTMKPSAPLSGVGSNSSGPAKPMGQEKR